MSGAGFITGDNWLTCERLFSGVGTWWLASTIASWTCGWRGRRTSLRLSPWSFSWVVALRIAAVLTAIDVFLIDSDRHCPFPCCCATRETKSSFSSVRTNSASFACAFNKTSLSNFSSSNVEEACGRNTRPWQVLNCGVFCCRPRGCWFAFWPEVSAARRVGGQKRGRIGCRQKNCSAPTDRRDYAIPLKVVDTATQGHGQIRRETKIGRK